MACPLSYGITLTGDCSNTSSGAVKFDIFGTAPGYSISGQSGNVVIPSSGTTYTFTGLSAGTYQYIIQDSCTSGNTTIPVNVTISSGTCISLTGVQNTICGLPNGSLTAQTTNYYGYSSFSLYGSTGYQTSATSINNTYIFTNLSADTYYVVGDDGGGCTGKSESCIVKSSTTLNFGLYVVNDTPCASTSLTNVGKIFVTGLTGVGPYTYLWSNGDTTSSISGLSTGLYSVTITDSTGCVASNTTFVDVVPSPSFAAVYVTPPTCFNNDGELNIIIVGGTPPFYISTSTGIIEVTLSRDITFTGISSGNITINGTDAGLCNFTTNVTVLPPSSFSVLGITVTNSNCNDLNGEILIQLIPTSTQFTCTLTDPLNNTQTLVQTQPFKFENLSSGSYDIEITDPGNLCVYTTTVTVTNTIQFTLSASTTGTTCDLDNGIVTLTVSGGTGNYMFDISGPTPNTVSSTFSSETFTNLASGTYFVEVIDMGTPSNCTQYLSFNIPSSTGVDFSLFAIDTFLGNDGEIYALISSGNPPFTFNWSPNVGIQTGLDIHMTGLTAGTYSLTLIDSSGCTQTRSVNLLGYNFISTSGTSTICSGTTEPAGVLQRTPKQMFWEGYFDLTSGETNCILNQAIFSAETIVSGVTASTPFFTANTLNEYPTVIQWAEVVEDLLLTYGDIGEVVIDIITNNISIISNCDNTFPLLDTTASIKLKIFYDISCETC